MKEFDQLILPDDLKYSEEHEWVSTDDETMRIGISDFAQDQLGDIVFVELPEIGARFGKGDEFATLESVKAVSEVYMPVGGEVLQVNPELEDAPELVNADPYGQGWLIEIKPDEPSQAEDLMDKAAYLAMIKGD
ncbi:MAG: glycine cleavage system protein GcvH [Desulfohalobiaceae bacterium]|nr:glycine cleavage system protein GcvH [Desulfohalobiaceae bacterium]